MKKFSFATFCMVLFACGGVSGSNNNAADTMSVDNNGKLVGRDDSRAKQGTLPFTDDVQQRVVWDRGKRAVRSVPDVSISNPGMMKVKRNCFIVMSKKDFYLYVYEAQGNDTVLLARYDCCFSLRLGNKERRGDMKTPHCTPQNPFKITQIQNASSWCHDFGDGRGSIKAYGNYFLRLLTPGHSGIGIHGSTNNRESVPGRASEGCIRLLDEDIIDLRKNYVFEGMKVIIKAEKIDDFPFEIRAMEKQGIERKRHFNPAKTLTNEQIAKVKPEKM